MIVTLDTNVLIAAFIARGQSHELLEHLIRHHSIVASAFILDEFRNTLVSKFGVSKSGARSAVRLLRRELTIVKPKALPSQVCRDEDDDWILATAVAGNADLLISGDKDLLDLSRYEGIAIIRPSDFWRMEADSDRHVA